MTATIYQLPTAKRESVVVPIFELPRGARDKRRGFRHDQIWFYDDPGIGAAETMRLSFTAEYWRGDAIRWFNQYWRFEHRTQRWQRLYMDRKYLFLPWGTLRLHTFWSGDEDAAPHDHPFDFWTFPLADYVETVEIFDEKDVMLGDVPCEYVGKSNFAAVRVRRLVRRFRVHRRAAEYRHWVHEPDRPFRTVVFARHPRRKWGFWPESDRFVPFEEWTRYE